MSGEPHGTSPASGRRQLVEARVLTEQLKRDFEGAGVSQSALFMARLYYHHAEDGRPLEELMARLKAYRDPDSN